VHHHEARTEGFSDALVLRIHLDTRYLDVIESEKPCIHPNA